MARHTTNFEYDTLNRKFCHLTNEMETLKKAHLEEIKHLKEEHQRELEAAREESRLVTKSELDDAIAEVMRRMDSICVDIGYGDWDPDDGGTPPLEAHVRFGYNNR